jgi:hypothetical protein
MKEWLQGVADRLYSTAAGWNPPEGTDLMVVGLGGLTVALNIALTRTSAAWGDRLLRAAADRLRREIAAAQWRRRPLDCVDVARLAAEIQRETGSVHLTDPVIAEAVRMAADQSAFRDPTLEALIVQVRDPGGLKPMSIANTNRLLSYSLSIVSLSLLVVVLQLASTRWLGGHWLASVLLWALLLPQGWVAITCARAWGYWRGRCRALEEEALTRVPCPPPRQLSRVWDFFAWIGGETSYRTVHVSWAPVWEEICFRLLPTVLGIYGGLWLTAKVLNAAGASPETARQVILVIVMVLLLCFLFGTSFVFATLHEYRWHEVGRLRRRLHALRRDWKLYRLGVIRTDPTAEFSAVGRRLWMITGHELYREPISGLD